MRDLKAYRPYFVPAILLTAIVVLEVFDIDNRVMAQIFDLSNQSFPLRYHWVTEGVIHNRGRQLMAVFGVFIIVMSIASFIVSPLRSVRREWVFVLVSIVTSTICVSTLKATTGVYCAYELLPYGGAYPANELSNLWQGGGACWPGGHVSGPFSLIALYFAFRSKHDVFAILALVTALVIGTIFGAGQALRGAHFPSHTLWTLLIIWVINITLMKFILSGPSVIQAYSGTRL